jgi:hypothetical protein
MNVRYIWDHKGLGAMSSVTFDVNTSELITT